MGAEAGVVLANYRALWDWRKRISDLYAQVRSREALLAWQHWRIVRDDLFRHHAQSPIISQKRRQFPGVPYFSYDPSLRYLVELSEPDNIGAASLPAGRDGEVMLHPFARTRGLAPLGNELTLYWIGGYGGGVFLPFRDDTSGSETFGGGRYLLDTIKGADLGRASDGRVILDFNFAYNPSCAYSDQWTCPLAPRENTLPSPIRGGERSREA